MKAQNVQGMPDLRTIILTARGREDTSNYVPIDGKPPQISAICGRQSGAIKSRDRALSSDQLRLVKGWK